METSLVTQWNVLSMHIKQEAWCFSLYLILTNTKLDEINGSFGIDIKELRQKKRSIAKKWGEILFWDRLNISGLEERTVFGFTKKGCYKSYWLCVATGRGHIISWNKWKQIQGSPWICHSCSWPQPETAGCSSLHQAENTMNFQQWRQQALFCPHLGRSRTVFWW